MICTDKETKENCRRDVKKKVKNEDQLYEYTKTIAHITWKRRLKSSYNGQNPICQINVMNTSLRVTTKQVKEVKRDSKGVEITVEMIQKKGEFTAESINSKSLKRNLSRA